MRHHFRRPQAMFNKGSLLYSHCGHVRTLLLEKRSLTRFLLLLLLLLVWLYVGRAGRPLIYEGPTKALSHCHAVAFLLPYSIGTKYINDLEKVLLGKHFFVFCFPTMNIKQCSHLKDCLCTATSSGQSWTNFGRIEKSVFVPCCGTFCAFLWHMVFCSLDLVNNCKSWIASQELQVRNCK
jgi:hypothetical protein